MIVQSIDSQMRQLSIGSSSAEQTENPEHEVNISINVAILKLILIPKWVY